MSAGEKKLSKKKLGNYPFFSVIFSITLSLLVIGLFGLITIYSNSLTSIIQENVEIQVYLDKRITESEKIKINKTISSKDFVLVKEDQPQIISISKEQAAEEFIKETGEDFIEFIGDNPLRDALIVKIDKNYQEPEKMESIRKEIESMSGVFEVTYVKNLVENINENLTKISLVLGGIAFLLILVVVILINNTIKLALFSQRFLIRSMQLVGATTWFIKWPFLRRAINYGILAGVISSAILYILLGYANSRIEDLSTLENHDLILLLMITLVFLGVLVGFTSTYRAVNRYLRMSLDELY